MMVFWRGRMLPVGKLIGGLGILLAVVTCLAALLVRYSMDVRMMQIQTRLILSNDSLADEVRDLRASVSASHRCAL